MASSINASLTAGLVQTADTSGILNLQSGGTTVATISSTGLAITGVMTSSSDATIHGLAVGNGASSGTGNVVIGPSAGSGLSTGSNNVIIGGYTGAAAPISASGSGQIVLSNGAGSIFGSSSSGGQWSLGQNVGVLTGLTATAVEANASSAGWSGLIAVSNDAGAYTQFTWNRATSGNNLFNAFTTEATVGTATIRGSISYNRAGGLTVYATTSDYRAKTVNGVIENALARTMQLKPCTGRMNDATENIDFFVAHELQAIIPSAVTGTKDAVKEDGTPDYQMVDKSAIIPLLVAAIQELKAEIDLLKGAK